MTRNDTKLFLLYAIWFAVLEVFPLVTSAAESRCGQLSQHLVIRSSRAISNTPILPDTPLAEIDRTACQIDITAAPGEFEPASVVLRAVSEIHNPLKLSVTALTGPGAPLGNDAIEIKMVKVWYQANGAWFSVGRPAITPDRPRLVPELLVNDLSLVRVDPARKQNELRIQAPGGSKYLSKSETARQPKLVKNLAPNYRLADTPGIRPFHLSKNSNQQVWLTLKVSPNAPQGLYRGGLQVHDANNKKLAEIPIQLHVVPFALPAPRLQYGMYYHGQLHPSMRESLSSQYKSEQQLRIELKDMLAHGINNPIVYQPHYISHSLFKKYLQIREQSGFDNRDLFFVYLNSNKVAGDRELQQFQRSIDEVKTLVKPFGTQKIYLYGKDEAKGQKLMAQKQAWSIAHRMGVNVFAAGYQGTFEAVGDLLDVFVLARSPMKNEADKFHSRGHKIFSYGNPQSGVENPYVYRLNYGVLLWASGFDGAMIYAYQHSMGDAWNDFDHKTYRDHNFTYPTSDGIIKTIAWEGLREGIDDVRYLTLLEQEIQKARGAGNSSRAGLADKAQAFLQSLRDQLNKLNQAGKVSRLAVMDLDQLRTKTIELLTQFGQTQGSGG